MIKVLLADDHSIVRAGLRRIVEESGDMEVIAEAADGRETIRLVGETSPDGFSTVGCFCNDLHITAFFNDAAKSGPDNTVVICQKHLDQIESPYLELLVISYSLLELACWPQSRLILPYY